MQVPRVFIGDECVGGGSDVADLHESGQLKDMLQSIGALQWDEGTVRDRVGEKGNKTEKGKSMQQQAGRESRYCSSDDTEQVIN